MGLTFGCWRLTGSGPLELAVIERGLRLATGLSVEPPGRGAGLRFPLLRQDLFDWGLDDAGVSVFGFAPPHPYVWENLDAVITALGGQPTDDATAWRPSPGHAGLRTRWSALSRRDRWLLALPSILGARPLDRFLRA
jgi:hypothetical protein